MRAAAETRARVLAPEMNAGQLALEVERLVDARARSLASIASTANRSRRPKSPPKSGSSSRDEM